MGINYQKTQLRHMGDTLMRLLSERSTTTSQTTPSGTTQQSGPSDQTGITSRRGSGRSRARNDGGDE